MKTFRRIVALILICLIIVGLYASVKGFSGYDLLSIDQGKVLTGITERGKQILNGSWLRKMPLATAIPQVKVQQKSVLLKVGLVSDSHNDSQNLQRALAQLKELGVSHILALGDYTQIGTFGELKTARQYFDDAQIPYSAVPGDHDLWDNKNKGEVATKNFEEVFGASYSSLNLSGIPMLMINNANNEYGIEPEQWQWIKEQLATYQARKQKCSVQRSASESAQVTCGMPFLVFLQEPLYHPTTTRIMGRLSSVADMQRKELIVLFKQAGVTEVISGDLHFFSRFSEPTQDIPMTTVGAVVNERNPQKPRFAVLTVYTDGSYDIDDTEIAKK